MSRRFDAGKQLPAITPSAQKSILASSRHPAMTSSARHAASAVKPPGKGGVRWADGATPAAQPASHRCPSQKPTLQLCEHKRVVCAVMSRGLPGLCARSQSMLRLNSGR